MTVCDSKGFLAFLVLWLLSRNPLTGAELALELEKRKGSRPSPGTVYPVLKRLTDNSLVRADQGKRYTLTAKGRRELQSHLRYFLAQFPDIEEMRRCCQ